MNKLQLFAIISVFVSFQNSSYGDNPDNAQKRPSKCQNVTAEPTFFHCWKNNLTCWTVGNGFEVKINCLFARLSNVINLQFILVSFNFHID